MFGTKFRSWMEAHIVRPRKKKDRKKEEKGFDSNCNSPTSHGTNRSPAPHQVHPVDPPSKTVDNSRLQASAYNTVTTTSGGTGSVHLSSPESAYSTGYSTDGTSPGASFPPEYYINIRTGTHYFQNNKIGPGKKSTEGSAPPVVGCGKPTDSDRMGAMESVSKRSGNYRERTTSTSNKNSDAFGIHQQVQADKSHQQLSIQKQQSHRRTESCSVDPARIASFLPIPPSIPPPLVPSPPLQSPRQRSRIRTNPWLSANSSGSSTNGVKSRVNLDESSSSSGLKLTESSGSASDVNVNGNAARSLEFRPGSLSAGRSPINQNWRINPRVEVRAKIPVMVQPRRSNSSSGSSVTCSVRSSEDDLTLNEMMGKYDESYVYEKETDILSDSDPTDCEDYVDSLSDIDTGQDGGDENEPCENEDFEFIDNGSILDLDKLETFRNTGHCAYFALTNDLNRKGTRLRESFLRLRTKEESNVHRASIRGAAKRQSQKVKKLDHAEKGGEKRKKRVSQRRKQPIFENRDDETANLNRVLVERMLLKNSGFNQGTRSLGGTPVCLRRERHDVNKNLSPVRLLRENLMTRTIMAEQVEATKRRSNSVSYVNGNLVRRDVCGKTYMTTFASEIALMEADKEADKKYRELIMEAENILVSMKNNSSPVMPSPRKIHNGLANKRVELIKNTELNIELALSKSRNTQPELQSGSIKDLEHPSPKRQFAQPCSPLHRFMERNSPHGLACKENIYKQDLPKAPDSPMIARRTPQQSPIRGCLQTRLQIKEAGERNEHGNKFPLTQGGTSTPGEGAIGSPYLNGNHVVLAHREKSLMTRKEVRAARTLKDDRLTSSSSDSDDRCEVRKKPPLMTFRSVDIGPDRGSSTYCPQSEPVKRKVYAGSATYGRIQKSLGEHNVAFRNSDGDTATDDTDDSKRSLKEKVAQLRQERLVADANLNAQESQSFQQQLSQLRRQMLVHTIEGLKRSLEDQSATLKQTCLETVLDNDVM